MKIFRKFSWKTYPNNKLFEEVPHLFGSEPTLRGYKFYKIYRLQGQDFNKTSIFNPLTTKKHCFDKISLSTCPQGSFISIIFKSMASGSVYTNKTFLIPALVPFSLSVNDAIVSLRGFVIILC